MKYFIWSCVVIIDYYNNIKLQWDGEEIHMIASFILYVEIKKIRRSLFPNSAGPLPKVVDGRKTTTTWDGHFMKFIWCALMAIHINFNEWLLISASAHIEHYYFQAELQLIHVAN